MASVDGECSAVLFRNEDRSVFLVDIPRSIALAQELTPSLSSPKHEDQSQAETPTSKARGGQRGRKRFLLSDTPRETSFISTEPKSQSARARVLQTIPVSERRFHGDFIQPVVQSALENIRAAFGSVEKQWCLPRRVPDAGRDGKRRWEQQSPSQTVPSNNDDAAPHTIGPPVILSSSSVNAFQSVSDLSGAVKNPSFESAILRIGPKDHNEDEPSEYSIPPQSTFLLCTLPLSHISPVNPIPGIPTTQKFNLALFDPPWPNRSVRRSSHYEVHPRDEMELLTSRLQDILRDYTLDQPGHYPEKQPSSVTPVSNEQQPQSQASLAAIWITNSEKVRRTACEALTTTGFQICEEWVWVKVTTNGQPISPLDGLWRRPYEILVIGRRGSPAHAGETAQSRKTDLLGIDPAGIKRRVIAAVPDLHSRKPNLKALFEEIFFRSSSVEQAVDSYSALEVFARNLTAGWWACGNEVLKFNARECWIEEKG